jgi:hypothetical protein
MAPQRAFPFLTYQYAFFSCSPFLFLNDFILSRFQSQYHPTRTMMVTTAKNGSMNLWVKAYRENMAAFAPDFEELHENQEYCFSF